MKSLTANRLSDGAVVYRGRDGGWTTRVAEAATFADDGAAALAEAAADVAACKVVGLDLIDVESVGGVTTPVSLRERIRAFGPTI